MLQVWPRQVHLPQTMSICYKKSRKKYGTMSAYYLQINPQKIEQQLKLYIDDLQAKLEETEQENRKIKAEMLNLQTKMSETERKLSKTAQEVRNKELSNRELINRIKKLEEKGKSGEPTPCKSRPELARKLFSLHHSPKNSEFPKKPPTRNLSSIRARKSSYGSYQNSFRSRRFSSISERKGKKTERTAGNLLCSFRIKENKQDMKQRSVSISRNMSVVDTPKGNVKHARNESVIENSSIRVKDISGMYASGIPKSISNSIMLKIKQNPYQKMKDGYKVKVAGKHSGKSLPGTSSGRSLYRLVQDKYGDQVIKHSQTQFYPSGQPAVNINYYSPIFSSFPINIIFTYNPAIIA
eukprot:TRINITY_DN88273_c1_g1_i1.p2 TRINITY_DN88273_c1_g1~~TRINITY_DN88273_c1_g1_i1.p2  ORF type:complete len:353 (-),score=14.84 TRINITY_DN88273_c1_g1_i1:1145-2203(-)